MLPTPKPPIILYEHGDVLIFSSVVAAEGYIEPIDIDNLEYVAYDSEGYELTLEVDSKDLVQIKEHTPIIDRANELVDRLRSHLIRRGIPEEEIEQAALSELVNRALEFKIDRW